MNRIKALLLAALLVLVPIVGLADDVGYHGVVDDVGGDDFVRGIPEPTSALLMGVGLAAVGLNLRRRR